MTFSSLVRRNLLHFWQTNLAVVAGVAVAIAILAGALLVGTSVRSSLRLLALERLGSVDIVVTSANFIDESFAKKLSEDPSIDGLFDDVVPLIAIEGFVTHQESGRRASGIQVYGVDDRFWSFHDLDSDAYPLGRRDVLISEGLAIELEADVDDTILLRVEKPSSVPISSLHGRREDSGRSLRLGVKKFLTSEEQGEFSFRPQQGRARSVFVSLARLQREFEQDAATNTFLLGVSSDIGFRLDSDERLEAVEAAVRNVASLEDIGLRVRTVPERQQLAVESAVGLLDDSTVMAVETTAAALGFESQPVLTYLVNSLRHGERVTPYSLVSAIDLGVVREKTEPDLDSGIVLNLWAANDLKAEVGDSIKLQYYVWEDEGRLVTREATVQVVEVVPINGAVNDPTLAPDFPGITQADDLVSWDPPFEIDLGLIRPSDEQYWDEFSTTPKAFIPLELGQELWRSRWGNVTSIRLDTTSESHGEADRFGSALRSVIDPLSVGFVAYPARSMALESSSGATDFGLYFFYFSFFLVVSALLLASLFFRLGVEQRLTEIGLLRATGFAPSAIWRVFSREAVLLSVLGSVIGVFAAVGYAEFIMWGLRTWWIDAVGTTRLGLSLSAAPLMGGAAGGLLAAFGSIALMLRSLIPASPRSLLSGVLAKSRFQTRGQSWFHPVWFAWMFLLSGILMVVLSGEGLFGATPGFFGGGFFLLCAMLTFSWVWLTRENRSAMPARWSVAQVGYRNVTARPGRSVLCIALIASAAFIIVAVESFRQEGEIDERNPKSGTGGYSLLADALLPIAHDLSSSEGREALNIKDLFEIGGPLEGVTVARFRVRPGEDASCLNLYQAKDPRILAPTDDFISMERFSFASSLAETPEEEANPWKLLHREFEDGAIPAIGDLTSLTYALHLGVGDEFILNRDTEHPIRLRIVAALSNSVLQRELLIAEDQFERVFSDYDGYRFFLADSATGKTGEVSAALEDRLADFGFDALPTSERLASFHRVNNTYLATFQTLGGLGLILGTFGLGAVLLRNVLERRRELALLRAVGYNVRHLSLLVLSENAFLLFAGLLTGTTCAIVAIAPAWIERGGGLPLASLALLLVLVVGAGLLASLVATVTAIRSPLLRALRTD